MKLKIPASKISFSAKPPELSKKAEEGLPKTSKVTESYAILQVMFFYNYKVLNHSHPQWFELLELDLYL